MYYYFLYLISIYYSLLQVKCFLPQNFLHLPGPSYGSGGTTPIIYSDNPNSLGFSGLGLDPLNPSLTLFANMYYSTTENLYSNVF